MVLQLTEIVFRFQSRLCSSVLWDMVFGVQVCVVCASVCGVCGVCMGVGGVWVCGCVVCVCVCGCGWCVCV